MTPQQPAQVMMPGNQPTPPPVFASDPLGQKPKTKSQTATSFGLGATPLQGTMPTKTLIGQ